jgi:hypothetical protein
LDELVNWMDDRDIVIEEKPKSAMQALNEGVTKMLSCGAIQ